MTTQIINVSPQNPEIDKIAIAAEVIKKGGLVAFPTETVYGLGADFFNKGAIEKLQRVKRRPPDKPFTAHIADLKELERFECAVSLFAKELMGRFWPGPLTLILDTKKSGAVGFRMPDNKIALELIRQSNTVIAAPSANISGYTPPRNAGEVLCQLKDMIDVVLDAGETRLGRESTVIDITEFPYRIEREGAISRDAIAEAEFHFWRNNIAPKIKTVLFVCTGNSCRSVMAEGYLRKRLRQIGRDDIEVFSRGTHAPILLGATDEAIAVLKAIGVDIADHRSCGLTEEDIKRADLILVMDRIHREEIIARIPSSRDKVYLLGEFGLWGGNSHNRPIEIKDPVGRPIERYREVFEVIKNSIERLVNILV